MVRSSWLVSKPFKFTPDRLPCPRVTIGELPDDCLLEIFGFYLDHQRDHQFEDTWPGPGHLLVHVCRRWRYLVYASPRRLRLRLLCTDRRPVKEALNIWPKLPIAIHALDFRPMMQALVTNVVAALEHHDRVCEIDLGAYETSLLEILSVMDKPFPSLVNLKVMSIVRNESMIPESFLGGSAPLLQSLEFYNIPLTCPEIKKLLLLAPNLVFICLILIPRSGPGFTSPEVMVNSLSMLTRLKSLRLSFSLQTPRPQLQQALANGNPPPFVRVVLPALIDFDFRCDKEYLDDFVSRIDTPLLVAVTINFLDRSIPITPPLRDFISRTEKFGPCYKINTNSSRDSIKIYFFRRYRESL